VTVGSVHRTSTFTDKIDTALGYRDTKTHPKKMADSSQKPEWLSRIESVMECPVCMVGMLDPPIFVCVNDHGVCKECRDRLRANRQPCPVCRGALTDRRSLLIEKVLDTFPKIRCKYSGCSFAMASQDKVTEHEEDCRLRMLPCLICGKLIALLNFTTHLRSEHDDDTDGYDASNWDMGNPQTIRVSFMGNVCWESTYLVVRDYGPHNIDFIFCFYLMSNMKPIYVKMYLFWIYHNQSKHDDQKYKYTIILKSEKARREGKDVNLLEHTAFCQPLDVSVQSIMKNQSFLAISHNLVSDAMEDYDEWRFTVRITPQH